MIGGRNPNHPSYFVDVVETVPVVESVPIVETVESVPVAEPEVVEPKEDEINKDDLYKLTKKEQVAKLVELGVSKEDIKNLKYEEDRINTIIGLRN